MKGMLDEVYLEEMIKFSICSARVERPCLSDADHPMGLTAPECRHEEKKTLEFWLQAD
jgi:hypothetical protein